jgi:hypothetical protein
MELWEHTAFEVEPHLAEVKRRLETVDRVKGWQLVAVVPVEGGARLLMFFRRPKEA